MKTVANSLLLVFCLFMAACAASATEPPQVDDNTILDFTNHGTVKLATTYIPKPNWTKDISKIEVKE